MDFNLLIARVKNLLLTPKMEWPVIAGETTSTADLYTKYIMIVAAVPALMGFIKASIIGSSLPFLGTYRIGFGLGLSSMVLQYALALGMTFVLALIIDALAPQFGGQKNQNQALKTAAYAYTAGWIASVFLILPWIGGVLALLGSLYGIYLMYLGLPHTMKSPPEQTTGYTVVIILLAIVLTVVTTMTVAAISGAGMMLGARGPLSGLNSLSDSSVKFDENSGLGKLAALGAKMEAANKKMEAAQKSGDADAQAKAAAAMLGNVLGGGDSVEALAPSALKAFVPETLDGLPRTRFSAEKNGAMGVQVSTARASYGDGQNRRVHLEITDTGGAKGIIGLAAWATVEQERETDTGYEKTYKSDGRLIHEQWDNSDHRGEYSIVLGDRFTVKVEGDADSIESLKAMVGSIDLIGIEALKNAGVSKG